MGLVAKAFQDIITFSRASSGTYVNSNGYITNSAVSNYLGYSSQPENALWTKNNSFVQQNLLTYSEQFDNAAWIKSNATVTANATIAPDGTLTADELLDTVANTNHFVSETPTLSAGVHTVSIYAKANVRRRLMLRENSFLGGAGIFDLISGTVVASIGAATASISSIGGGWYRCSVVNPSLPGGATQFGVYVMPDAATVVADAVYIGTGTGLYIWGAQLVQGSVPGDYRATTSAALPCLYADYNGALRARKLCESTATAAHFAYQTGPGAGQYVLSEFFKAGERTRVALGNSGVGDYAVFDLIAGTVISAGSGTVSGGQIVGIGNGWYRCTVLCTPAGAWVPAMVICNAAGSTSYTGDGTSGIYIADAQLNDGSAATAYWDNATGSATYAPRFDYDPVTLAAKGLLVEESRTNLLVRSNDWSTSWNLVNITQTPAQAIGPDGTMSMTKIAATATAVTLCAQGAVATSTSQTYSIYAKQGSGPTDANYFAVYNNTTATSLAILSINYATGVITQTTGTGAYSQNAGNGIWRIVIPVTSGITVGNNIAGYFGFVGGPETAGEYAYAYGAQMEVGTFPTSYIPTVASQVTRAADVASVNTLSPWFNSATGTFYAEYLINSFANSSAAVSLNVSNSGFNVSGSGAARWWNGTTNVVSANTVSTGINRKEAFAFASGARDICLNGGAVATDANVAWPSVPSAMFLGSAASGANTQNINGWLRRVTFYPRRLTNAELQTLTTL